MLGVITTIAKPTESVKKFVEKFQKNGANIIIVGDKKGPEDYDIESTIFLSYVMQIGLDINLAKNLPSNHYARKNIGYLYAIGQGADFIYETDDDNAPCESWALRDLEVSAKPAEAKGWINVYKYFSDALIWPRGLPLEQIRNPASFPKHGDGIVAIEAPIQQGLANGSPDVDAVWRLVCDQDITFIDRPSIHLKPGAWCPFNSQSTWWWPVAYPLMYLPSYCSFRMTDIWRSFVAQRCLWELGFGVVFHKAEVFQDRNPHNLMTDFNAEVCGYSGNQRFVDVLQGLHLLSGPENVHSNLLKCYDALVANEFYPEKELTLVRAWISDLETIAKTNCTGDTL